MILYGLYRIGSFISLTLPLKVSYFLAYLVACICHRIYGDSREAVYSNLKVVMGDSCDDKKLRSMTKKVFVNFAKYLVDFFRFSIMDGEYIKKFVKVEGLSNVDDALLKGKGVILLSAHIGNWELGGLVMGALRPPVSAVVLTHKNKEINDFFTRQRLMANFKPIEIGITLRACFSVLKNNGLLALLGDRDFSKSGMYTNFFGKPALIPKGPAVFSCRLGSIIIPTFMIREPDDTFRLIMEKPIYPVMQGDEEKSVKKLMEEYSAVIESYVRRYPDQWYMFREVWNNNGK